MGKDKDGNQKEGKLSTQHWLDATRCWSAKFTPEDMNDEAFFFDCVPASDEDVLLPSATTSNELSDEDPKHRTSMKTLESEQYVHSEYGGNAATAASSPGTEFNDSEPKSNKVSASQPVQQPGINQSTETEGQVAGLNLQGLEAPLTPLDYLTRAVEEALTLGRQNKCPKCSTMTTKIGGCMHMTCEDPPGCGCQWCYCCGHERKNTYCETCDRHLPTILDSSPESQWKTAGCSDFHDFHGGKTLYFLKKIKQSVPSSLWNMLENQRPHLVNGKIVEGNGWLRWKNIDKATLKLYGRTRPENILWRHEIDDTITKLQANIRFCKNFIQIAETPSWNHNFGTATTQSGEFDGVELEKSQEACCKNDSTTTAVWVVTFVAVFFFAFAPVLRGKVGRP